MITTKNNSNVGNLISGAVNLRMHTMPRNKPKVNDSNSEKKTEEPIVNENWKPEKERKTEWKEEQ